jgi:ribosomal protein S18 acetylase RimI-like enzyme
MNVRAAIETDVSVLLDMIHDFFDGEGMPFDAKNVSPALTSLLGSPSLGSVWIFQQAKAVVGYAIVTYGFDLEFNGRDAFLTDLYLIPEWRGQGVGSAALAIVEREARQAGVRALHLLVHPTNDRALRLYRNARFEVSHRTVMTKRLG